MLPYCHVVSSTQQPQCCLSTTLACAEFPRFRFLKGGNPSRNSSLAYISLACYNASLNCNFPTKQLSWWCRASESESDHLFSAAALLSRRRPLAAAVRVTSAHRVRGLGCHGNFARSSRDAAHRFLVTAPLKGGGRGEGSPAAPEQMRVLAADIDCTPPPACVKGEEIRRDLCPSEPPRLPARL